MVASSLFTKIWLHLLQTASQTTKRQPFRRTNHQARPPFSVCRWKCHTLKYVEVDRNLYSSHRLETEKTFIFAAAHKRCRFFITTFGCRACLYVQRAYFWCTLCRQCYPRSPHLRRLPLPDTVGIFSVWYATHSCHLAPATNSAAQFAWNH